MLAPHENSNVVFFSVLLSLNYILMYHIVLSYAPKSSKILVIRI